MTTGVNNISGDFVAQGIRIAIVAGRFNSFIVDHLLAGAVDTLVRHGVEAKTIDVVQRLAATKQYDGIIALGCVIRGATPHFDYVAGECAKGIAAVALKFDLPIAFGVLTVDNIEQAVERAGTKAGNKGVEAAMSVLEMVSLFKRLG